MGNERISLTKGKLDAAVDNGLLAADQSQTLWDFLLEQQGTAIQFNLSNVALYAGALIVISAMGWYLTRAWVTMSGVGFMATAVLYASVFLVAGIILWRKPGGHVPGGLLITLAVCMVPMGVYGLEIVTGLWPQAPPNFYRDFFSRAKACWLIMELATVLAGLAALRVFRFPFLAAPISVALWFMSMDLTPLLFGQADFTWSERRWVSLWFGLTMLGAAYCVDRLTREDLAFWGYLFGVLAFWGGLTSLDSNSELGKFIYCCINVGLLLVAILLQRRVFLVFGGLGISIYLGHLSRKMFRDSMAFPFVLSAIGLGVMWLGLMYQRNGAAVEAAVLRWMPAWVRRSLPMKRVTSFSDVG